MEKEFTLSDGTKVSVRKVWNCCEGWCECGSVYEVYGEDGGYIGVLDSPMPDPDDYDLTDENEVAAYNGEMEFFLKDLEDSVFNSPMMGLC